MTKLFRLSDHKNSDFQLLIIWAKVVRFSKKMFLGIIIFRSMIIPNLNKIQRGGLHFVFFLDHLTWNDPIRSLTYIVIPKQYFIITVCGLLAVCLAKYECYANFLQQTTNSI